MLVDNIKLCLVLLIVLGITHNIYYVGYIRFRQPDVLDFRIHHKSDEGKICEPKVSVAFAKTHKTGSTTLQNILLRYGYLRDLTFAIPARRGWMFNQSRPLNASTSVRRYYKNPANMFNFFASHSQWNLKEVQKLVGIKAEFITILRDPVEVFESGYVYFGIQDFLQMDINQFVHEIGSPKRSKTAIFGKNQLLYNLGMTAENMESPIKVNQMVKSIEENFSLVLIAEKMEESLILLKELLCWNLQDINYMRLNERSDETKSQMEAQTKAKLKKWLWADYKLYNHFSKRLDEKIKDFGLQEMTKEVEFLKLANYQLEKNCHKTYLDNSNLKGTVYFMASDAVKGVSLDPNCTLYAISEPYFFRLIRLKQRMLLD